jgi:hypothetical protein
MAEAILYPQTPHYDCFASLATTARARTAHHFAGMTKIWPG